MKSQSAPLSQASKPLDLAERVALLDREPISWRAMMHSAEAEAALAVVEMEYSTSSSHPPDVQRAESEIAYQRILQREIEVIHQHHAGAQGYTPRAPQSCESISPTTRVSPRNPRHARELKRNRAAASKYRKRRKAQIESLVRRARQQENMLIAQRQLVTDLQKELHHLAQVYLTTAEMGSLQEGMSTPGIKQEVSDERTSRR